jgi:hypothetical protein
MCAGGHASFDAVDAPAYAKTPEPPGPPPFPCRPLPFLPWCETLVMASVKLLPCSCTSWRPGILGKFGPLPQSIFAGLARLDQMSDGRTCSKEDDGHVRSLPFGLVWLAREKEISRGLLALSLVAAALEICHRFLRVFSRSLPVPVTEPAATAASHSVWLCLSRVLLLSPPRPSPTIARKACCSLRPSPRPRGCGLP